MTHEGQARHPELDFQRADAMNLRFADDSFNAVTINFGLRSVVDPDQVLREFYRVLCPGGHLVVRESSHPTWASFRALYRFFLGTVPPPIACLAFGDAVVYDYLTGSISARSPQYQFATRLRDAGSGRLQLRSPTGGIVVLHRGYKLK